MSKLLKFLVLTIILLLTACNPGEEINPDQDAAERILTAAAATIKASEAEPEPTSTEAPPPPQETPVPTLRPAYLATAYVTSETLNLRAGPGTFYEIVQSYIKGTQVTTLEMTPDGRWIRVAAPGSEGWMSADYLDLTELEAALPIINWPESHMLYGTVLDNYSNPVSAARIAATSGEKRAEAISTGEGEFYFYIPAELEGPIKLEIVAINCSSTIAEIQPNGSCLVTDYFPVHWQQTVTLPQTQPVHFLYEAAIVLLPGKVAYQDGNGASQILVRATRLSDGVQSESVTPVGGEFNLPLGEGDWEIVAVRFLQDGTPLISETRIYSITIDGQELETLIIPYNEIVERN